MTLIGGLARFANSICGVSVKEYQTQSNNPLPLELWIHVWKYIDTIEAYTTIKSLSTENNMDWPWKDALKHKVFRIAYPFSYHMTKEMMRHVSKLQILHHDHVHTSLIQRVYSYFRPDIVEVIGDIPDIYVSDHTLNNPTIELLLQTKNIRVSFKHGRDIFQWDSPKSIQIHAIKGHCLPLGILMKRVLEIEELGIDHKGTCERIFMFTPFLKSLYWMQGVCVGRDLAQFLPRLTKLTLFAMQFIDGLEIPTLEELEIEDPPSTFVGKEIYTMPRLQELVIKHSRSFSGESLHLLTNLRKLTLYICPNVQTEHLQHLKNLEILYIKACYSISGDFLLTLDKLCDFYVYNCCFAPEDIAKLGMKCRESKRICKVGGTLNWNFDDLESRNMKHGNLRKIISSIIELDNKMDKRGGTASFFSEDIGRDYETMSYYSIPVYEPIENVDN